MATADWTAARRVLEDPRTYGVTPDEVSVIETHVAVVVRVGERAYKIKKPVDLGFLDFTTLAARESAIRAELDLNRRLAPEIYLDVVAIVRSASGELRLGGEGEAMEWVLVMRRFADDTLYDRITVEGRLDGARIDGLAAEIERIHRAAAVYPDHPSAAGFARTIAGVCRNTEAFAGGLLDEGAVKIMASGLRTALARAARPLDVRAAAGLVRWCHGDLHLRNICEIDGRPRLFDCIEFNRDFAIIDVLYDLAFLLMDLVHRGHVADANRLLNGYLARVPKGEALAQYAGVALLPLFIAARAGIRTHVTATLAADLGREADAETARAYLADAIAALVPAKPVIVAVGGLSGSGKSTLARSLAPMLGGRTGAVIVRSDEIRKNLHDRPPTDRLPAEAYRPEVSAAVYRELRARAERVAQGGEAVILDAVFDREDDRRIVETWAAALGAPFVGLWLDGAVDALAARIDAREGDASDATAAVLAKQGLTGDLGWHRIEACRPRAEVLADAAGRLAAYLRT